MSMTITGTVTQVLDEQSGTGRKGEWRKQEYILNTGGEYQTDVCIVVWGPHIDAFGLSEGHQITAHLDIASREYNGRWYTDVKCWKVERPEGAAPAATPPAGGSGAEDDLPFAPVEGV